MPIDYDKEENRLRDAIYWQQRAASCYELARRMNSSRWQQEAAKASKLAREAMNIE